MAKLRRDTQSDSSPLPPPLPKPLRIIASGTVFLTHTLTLQSFPVPSTAVRARSVRKARGGSANIVLSILTQFAGAETVLVASLAGNDEGKMIIGDLEREGVNTHYCKVWPNAGVPSAWVIHSKEGNTRTVINHNPLPDVTHEDFVSMLGPLLAPENYSQLSPTSPLALPSNQSISSLNSIPLPPFSINPSSPAPFDWLHFEGRSVKTTLSNLTGLDGLARERKWRRYCVFSIDLSRKGRQGVEALIPHADVLFVSKQYAQSVSPQYATSPRTFLLSLTSTAAPHALIVANWGSEGAAVLSVPTREYFQSSGWVEEQPQSVAKPKDSPAKQFGEASEFQSVRSGSAYWADGRTRTLSSSSAANYLSDLTHDGQRDKGTSVQEEDDDNDSQGTETPATANGDGEIVDEPGAQDAFIAGMIYALSRKLCPGPLYTPISAGDYARSGAENERARWRLDECLRFATELAGRRARLSDWGGLGEEMTRAGWFD